MNKEHNPDRLTPEQYGKAEGWRLLEEDEVFGTMNCNNVQSWGCLSHTWETCVEHGEMWQGLVYRTRLSRAELRKARGLEPEESVEIYDPYETPVHPASVDEIAREATEKAWGRFCTGPDHWTAKRLFETAFSSVATDAIRLATAHKDAEIARRCEDVTRMGAAINRLTTAAEDRNQVDLNRQVLHVQEKDELRAEIARLKEERDAERLRIVQVNHEWSLASKELTSRIAELEKERDRCGSAINIHISMEAKLRSERDQLRADLEARTRDWEYLKGVRDSLQLENAALKSKLDYVHSMGLRFGMMKSSDKPEPYLAHTWTDSSDQARMFKEWSQSIGWEERETNLRAENVALTAAKDKAAEENGRLREEFAKLKTSFDAAQATIFDISHE